MGFGSYDESEQEDQSDEGNLDDDEAVTVHEHEHDGSMTVEGGEDQDELIDRLQDIKD